MKRYLIKGIGFRSAHYDWSDIWKNMVVALEPEWPGPLPGSIASSFTVCGVDEGEKCSEYGIAIGATYYCSHLFLEELS